MGKEEVIMRNKLNESYKCVNFKLCHKTKILAFIIVTYHLLNIQKNVSWVDLLNKLFQRLENIFGGSQAICNYALTRFMCYSRSWGGRFHWSFFILGFISLKTNIDRTVAIINMDTF